MIARKPLFYWVVLGAAILAFGVVVLGAYVRLSNAGLGCPDWPGCYGHVTVPDTPHVVMNEDAAWPGRPVVAAKAWKEMIHRYFAGSLGVLILLIAVLAWRRRQQPEQSVGLPLLLVALVIIQALLGMWTVTLLLLPVVVMGHLLGGMTIFALLVLLVLNSGEHLRLQAPPTEAWPRRLAMAGLVILILQIALGGWTSSNYAAVACPDFPTCQGQWWPDMNFIGAFLHWHGIGIDYEGGVLHNAARIAIHMTHRLGALLTFLVLGVLSLLTMMRMQERKLKILGALVGVCLLVQVLLGIGMVVTGFPLPLADAHNAGAAILLASMVMLNYALWSNRKPGYV